MKTKPKKDQAMVLRDDVAPYNVSIEPETMVRTQIYLTRAEHEFLQGESSRRNEPMAAVIRSFIDEKMTLPEDVWTANPLLSATQEAGSWDGKEDGSINHDHYVYGTPPRYKKKQGKWVLKSPEEA